jgi:hypothetical protein
MNSKGIGIALGVFAVLLALTLYAYRSKDTDSGPTLTNPWAALTKDRVDHVSIRRPSAAEAERSLDFEKSGGAWRMTAPGAGPTEPRALEDLIDRFAEMKVVSVAGRNTSSYEAFEVDDAHATRVTLKSGSTVLLDVYVGTAIGSGTAVRAPGKNEIFQVDQLINSMVTRAPRDWRDRDITHVSRDAIRSVEWTGGRAGALRFTRNGDTWTPATGTTVARLDTARVSSLVDTITNLRASDFAAPGATSGANDASPRVVIETEGDGGAGRVVVRLGNNSGDQEALAQREGNDVVFVITRSQADAINPELSAFQAPLPVDGGTAADASAPAPAPTAAMPLDPSAMPGNIAAPGGQQIPPEVMAQIRRQLQQQQAGGAH